MHTSKYYYIESAQVSSFCGQLQKEYRVFLPQAKDPQGQKTDYCYQVASSDSPFSYNPYRTVEPLKSFFTQAYEKVSDYFAGGKPIVDVAEKTIIFGVKNCDLVGHKIQDFVFLEGVEVDSLYRLRRENTFLVCGDCTDYKDVCHCLAWEILPYATAGFDLNLSPINDGYVVEVGSGAAEALVVKYRQFFIPAKETQIAARKIKRDALIEKLKKHLLPQNLVSKEHVQTLMRQGFSLDTWKQFMNTCVECGGCNLICDTCHCFLLADKEEKNVNQKIRIWDSCLYANYARVAGGANPLKTRAQRLRNRFLKKFDFFVDNLGMPACCGCGRCIEVCPGKIDIREVLKDLQEKLKSKTV